MTSTFNVRYVDIVFSIGAKIFKSAFELIGKKMNIVVQMLVAISVLCNMLICGWPGVSCYIFAKCIFLGKTAVSIESNYSIESKLARN